LINIIIRNVNSKLFFEPLWIGPMESIMEV